MTPRERFLKVLAGEMPDRVPVTLFQVAIFINGRRLQREPFQAQDVWLLVHGSNW